MVAPPRMMMMENVSTNGNRCDIHELGGTSWGSSGKRIYVWLMSQMWQLGHNLFSQNVKNARSSEDQVKSYLFIYILRATFINREISLKFKNKNYHIVDVFLCSFDH